MAATLRILFGVVCLVGVSSGGSVPFFKDIMKVLSKDELNTVAEYMTIDKRPFDHSDITPKFACGEDACDVCTSIKIAGQKREICVKEYNRKSKPSGLSALYVDGKNLQEFTVFNEYCQHYWGLIAGCLTVYDRAPTKGITCYKVDINLIFTLVSIDFGCVKHEGGSITLDKAIPPRKVGSGILKIDLFRKDQPEFKIVQKDEETVNLVTTAVKELLEKM